MEGGSLGEAVGALSLLPSPLTNSPREAASPSVSVKLAAGSCGAPEAPEHSRCFSISPSVVPHEVGHRHFSLSDVEIEPKGAKQLPKVRGRGGGVTLGHPGTQVCLLHSPKHCLSGAAGDSGDS